MRQCHQHYRLVNIHFWIFYSGFVLYVFNKFSVLFRLKILNDSSNNKIQAKQIINKNCNRSVFKSITTKKETSHTHFNLNNNYV